DLEKELRNRHVPERGVLVALAADAGQHAAVPAERAERRVEHRPVDHAGPAVTVASEVLDDVVLETQPALGALVVLPVLRRAVGPVERVVPVPLGDGAGAAPLRVEPAREMAPVEGVLGPVHLELTLALVEVSAELQLLADPRVGVPAVPVPTRV